MIVILLVDERCVSLRSYTERSSGDITSENAGMSSENYVRIIMVENLRFLEEGSSAQGKPGAKARLKCVADGQQVQIPVPHGIRTVGTQKDSTTGGQSPGQAG